MSEGRDRNERHSTKAEQQYHHPGSYLNVRAWANVKIEPPSVLRRTCERVEKAEQQYHHPGSYLNVGAWANVKIEPSSVLQRTIRANGTVQKRNNSTIIQGPISTLGHRLMSRKNHLQLHPLCKGLNTRGCLSPTPCMLGLVGLLVVPFRAQGEVEWMHGLLWMLEQCDVPPCCLRS